MSWSVHGITYEENGQANLLDLVYETAKERGTKLEGEGVNDQVITAVDAALWTIRSGAVGEGKFTISISGHANPGHRPTVGYANDMVVITVVQVGQPEPK